MAPIVRGRKGEYKKDLEKLARQGFVRARIDGVLRSLDEEITLDKRKNHTIEVVVDRLLVKPGIEKRLEASIDTATKLANGLVLIVVVNGDERLYSQKLACMECGTSVPQLEPRSFSFNSPYGACEACHGLGSQWSFDPAKVIADPSKPLFDGGLGPGASSWYMQQKVEELAKKSRVNLKKSFDDMPKKAREALLDGILAILQRDVRFVLRGLPRVADRVHVAAPLPGVLRAAAAAGEPRGAGQELLHRRLHVACRSRAR